jgi:hypothetical protein
VFRRESGYVFSDGCWIRSSLLNNGEIELETYIGSCIDHQPYVYLNIEDMPNHLVLNKEIMEN